MTGLVIDLRDNPGGNLDTVCDILDLILPEGTIVSTKDKNGEGETYTSDEEHKLEIPLSVLTNGNSASASEILRVRFRIMELEHLWEQLHSEKDRTTDISVDRWNKY